MNKVIVTGISTNGNRVSVTAGRSFVSYTAQLNDEQLEAIQNSNYPSETNPFSTISQIGKQYLNPTETDLLFVYGQSNAKGTAGNTDGVPTVLSENVKVWDGTDLINLTSYTPTADDGTSTGSAWASFGNEYTNQTGRKLIILNAAKDSQSISALQKGSANYTALTTWYDDLITYSAANGIIIGKRLLAFNQGEADANNVTTPVSYNSLLTTLWTDLKTDFGIELMGLFTVGYYADFRIKQGQVIQQAQRNFAIDNDDVIIAYDHLGAFGSNNNLKVDSVHYNQKGYNIMGREGAKRIVSAIFPDTASPASDEIINRFGSLGINQSQAWNLHSAILEKKAGEWNANHSNLRSSSFILGGTELSDRLRIKISCPATTVLSAFAKINGEVEAGGMRVSIGNTKQWAATIASSTDSDGYSYVDLFFYINIYMRINMATGVADVTAMGSEFANLLDDITVTYPSTGRCDIAHPNTKGLAIGSIIGGTARNIRTNAGTTSTIIQTRNAADALVNDTVSVMLPNILIAPSKLALTTNISFQMIAADYAIW